MNIILTSFSNSQWSIAFLLAKLFFFSLSHSRHIRSIMSINQIWIYFFHTNKRQGDFLIPTYSKKCNQLDSNLHITTWSNNNYIQFLGTIRIIKQLIIIVTKYLNRSFIIFLFFSVRNDSYPFDEILNRKNQSNNVFSFLIYSSIKSIKSFFSLNSIYFYLFLRRKKKEEKERTHKNERRGRKKNNDDRKLRKEMNRCRDQ